MSQVPILVLLLAVRRVVCALASRRLSPARIIGSTGEDSSGAKLFSGFVVAVSVTGLFFQDWVVSPASNPQTWRASWCGVSVFILVDGLPAKANELHPPVDGDES